MIRDKATGMIQIRRCFAMVIAAVMALTMFTGMTSISHAATVSGAKATNYGFRMVRVSWSAVKVEIPQEPAEPEEPADPVDPATDPTTDPTTDPATDPTTDPATDPTTDPVTDPTTDPVTDPATDPNAQGGEPAADPNGEPTSDPAADPNGVPAVQSSGGLVLDSDGVQTEPSADPNGEPAVQGSSEPVAEGDGVQTEPSADSNGAPAVQSSGEPVAEGDGVQAEPADDSGLTLMTQTAPKPVYDVITYKVYRSTAKSGKYSLIKKTKATSFINKGVKVGKRYYYKVIAYRSNGKKYGTSAIVSIKVAKKVTAKMTLLKKGNAAFNFRIAAKQKLYRYDTLQGACANGGYAYLTLYNRNVERCKIVKVKLSNLSVVKVSASLPIYHGNNLTFNTRKNRIVATCCTTSKKAKNRVVLINPSTLKVTSIKNIKLTKKVKKLPKKVRKKNKGYTAVAYNEKHNCYVARLRQNGNVVILNKNLKPVRYVKLKKKKTGLLVQGIETVGDYIYDVRSFKGRHHYCMVTVHTMSGKYVGQMKFPYGTAPGKELQCLFHNGRQFYAGFYYSTSQMDDTKKNHVNRVNLIQRLNNL